MSWEAIKRIARADRPELFGVITSGMSKEERSSIDRARQLAYIQASNKYHLMPKAERDYWRKEAT